MVAARITGKAPSLDVSSHGRNARAYSVSNKVPQFGVSALPRRTSMATRPGHARIGTLTSLMCLGGTETPEALALNKRVKSC